MRFSNPMGFKKKIARKKARAIIQTALVIGLLFDLNALIEYFKVLPEDGEIAIVIQNSPLKVDVAYAESRENATSQPVLEAKEATEPEKEIEALEGRFYAYSDEVGQTDANPRRTASGKEVFEGLIANNCLPFGTKVKVEGRGIYEVQDRMNARYGCETFDVFFETKGEAMKFGKRSLKYSVLE